MQSLPSKPRSRAICLALILIGLMLATPSLYAAGPNAFTPPASGLVVGHDPNHAVNLGNVFTVNNDIWVTGLSFYAENGAATFVNDETVTIYDATGNVLTSAVVSHTGATVNGYYWKAIVPVQLHAGNSYTVSAFVGANSWAYGGVPTTASEITYTEHRYKYDAVVGYPTDTINLSGDAYYGPNFTFAAAPNATGNVVVSNDEWMFENSFITNGNDDLQFAKNLASFVAGPSGSILILSDNPRFGSTFINTLHAQGYTTTATNVIPPSFAGYNAIFMAGAVPNSTNLNSMLTSFVIGGGGVVVEGGTSWGFSSGPDEANYWKPFLNNFGLAYAPSYNGIIGNINVSAFTSQTPFGSALFNSVNLIYMNNGNNVLLADPSHPVSNVQLFSDPNQRGLFGVFSNRVGNNFITPADQITLPAEPQSTFAGGTGTSHVDTFITPYTASQDGWITSWQTEFLGPAVAAGVQLKVFRSTPDGMQVVAEGPVNDPRPILQQRFGASYPSFTASASLTAFQDSPIPVKAGDYIGITISAGVSGTYSYPMVGPPGTVQVQHDVTMGQTISLTDPQTHSIAQPPALTFTIAPKSTQNPLTLLNNYFVTGDYASAGVTLRGTGIGGVATGTITIPNSIQSPNQGVPDGADIVAAYLYWQTLESSPLPSAGIGTFRGYTISGQKIGNDVSYTDGAFTGTMRVYRADVSAYMPIINGVRYGSGSHTVKLSDAGGTGLPLTEGASLVLVYRVSSHQFPLKAVVIYEGATTATSSPMLQVMEGFYDAANGNSLAKTTNIYTSGGTWNNTFNMVSPTSDSQFDAVLNTGAWGAVVFSTPVTNSDNDGILDAWKSGPPPPDAHAGESGYYDVKDHSWVSLAGAQHGLQDVFVQVDYMCSTVLPNGTCDPSGHSHYPSPDANGRNPLAMVQQAFASRGINMHFVIGNAVPEDSCTDNTSVNPQQLCQFPNESGVINWKFGLEVSKVWPKNLISCLSGGDCTSRYAHGQKDSYHYVLFGHSLAIPAWNTRWGTLVSIRVSNGQTTINTADRGNGLQACPSRITISGALGNPTLNGVYNTSGCANNSTISLATPGVPDWQYPNSDLSEPVMGVTSGVISSISGFSDLGGADTAVTLGKWETSPEQDMSKRANVIAGTLMHEIGHTLALAHGGTYFDTPNSFIPTFEGNCKPNYQSIMNYLFQLDLLGTNQTLDYSGQQLQLLNESSLSSVTSLRGLNLAAAAIPTSAWYVPVLPGDTASAATRHCDGTPLVAGESMHRVNAPVALIVPPWTNGQDINFDGQQNASMRGFDDWGNLDLRQVGATGGEFAALAGVLGFNGNTPLTVGAGGNVTLGSGGTVTLGSGGTVTLGSGGTVTLGSGGTIALGSGGTVTLGAGGTYTIPASGGTITLGSGGTVTLGSGGNVTLGSGGLVTLGSGGNVTLGSGGNVTLGSGGTVTLGSGGTVTLGSGGNVTLGSGGTIALGSGGTVTLGSGGTVTLGSGGTITLGSGGTVTLGAGGSFTLPAGGGTITLGSGGTVTLGSGGNVTLGSGGTITMGSGGTVTLGSGGNVTLGSGGVVTLGSGGNIALGSGGNVTLGSGGTVTLGSGGTATNELEYETADSIVRSPASPTKTPTTNGVRIDWTAPQFGVISSYVIYRSVNDGTPVAIGTVTGNPPVTTFTDTNPPTNAGTVAYTISTGITNQGETTRESPPSEPAILKFDQTISFAPLPNKRASDPPFAVTATVSPSNMLVNFSATGNCTASPSTKNGNVSSSTITLNGSGSCTVMASQIGSDQYNAATNVSNTFLIAEATAVNYSQTITFAALSNKTFGDADFPVSASASSNLPVTFSGGSAACSVNATGMVHILAAGNCPITASQAGNNTYNPATPVTQPFTVNKAPAAISISNIPTSAAFGGSFVPAYTYNGDGTKSVTSGTMSVCTVSGSTVNFVGVGNCSLTAHATAGTNYLAADGTAQTFYVAKATTPISITNIPTNAINGGSFIPGYTYLGDGTKSVTSSTAGICTVSGGTVNFVGIGTCTLTAHATAGAHYMAVDGSPQSFGVANRPPVALAHNVTVDADASCTAAASINNGSYDPDGDAITLKQTPPGPYSVGTTSVSLKVTDSRTAFSTATASVFVRRFNRINVNNTNTQSGKKVTIKLTVSVTSTCGTGAYTGTVQFNYSGTLNGTMTVPISSTGTATITLPVMNTPVNESFSATYSGDANNVGVVSGVKNTQVF